MSPTPSADARAALAALALAISGTGCTTPPVAQPLPFNHRLHVGGGIDCVACHPGVRTAARAGLPRVAVCMECHEADVTDAPAARPHIELVRRHAGAGTELEWQNVYVLPAHVYYSHRRHVAIAKLACGTCHGDVAERTAPPVEPVAGTLAMATCMGCHEARGVGNDCARCHR